MTEAEILKAIAKGRLSLPPLQIEASRQSPRSAGTGLQPDAFVTVIWDGTPWDFVVEIKARSVPKVFDEALRRVRLLATETNRLPMIVAPHFRPEQLDAAASAGVSAVDLSGNGVVIVPSRLLVHRTGQPNRYREQRPNRFAYRGTTSIVARAVLCRARFESSSALRAEIQRRGGNLVPSTISKALQRMEEDLVVTRMQRAIELLQPDTLLAHLVESYRPPPVGQRVGFKLGSSWRDALAKALATRPVASNRVALSGTASASHWAVLGQSDPPVVYCEDPFELTVELLSIGSPDDRFPTIWLAETDDQQVYFDVRTEAGVPYASPVQTFIELATGDKRYRDTATQVQARILADLARERAESSTE